VPPLESGVKFFSLKMKIIPTYNTNYERLRNHTQKLNLVVKKKLSGKNCINESIQKKFDYFDVL
jgi:hypothetical protein